MEEKTLKFQEVLGFEESFEEYHIDPLHGPIGITNEENIIIKSDYFQRLKYIRQLGLVHHFYHSATHTRYEHSLGVLHTTWAMFKRIFSNYGTKNHSYFTNTKILEKLANPRIIRALRIAGLCHDLGHGPLSHTFEIISGELSSKAQNHDEITYDIIEKGKIEVAKDIHSLVLAILNPSKRLSEEEEFKEFYLFLHDIVAGDIGSDRIDYLLRDTYMTGLGHRFGLNHLLEAISAIYDKKRERLYLSIEASEKDAVLYFLTTRFYHFQLLANCKNNVQREAEFKASFKDYVRSECSDDEIQDVISRMQEMTDDEVKHKLKNYESTRLVMLAKWILNDMALPLVRFFVYRFSYKNDIRRVYTKAIQNYLKNTEGCKDNLILSFNVQKGRIPAIPVTLSSYKRIRPPRNKGGKTTIEFLNSLLHEFSPLLFGLARTYLGNTMITVFGRNEDPNMEDKLSRSPKFLVHDNVVEETLTECSKIIEQEDNHFVSCDRLDFLILFVEALRITKTMMIDEKGLKGKFHRFGYLQYLINKTQELVFSKDTKPPYEFNEQSYFFNPGRGDEAFLFHKTLFNDLFLLEIFKILEIEPYYDEKSPVENEVHYYPSYKFTFNLSNLAKITSRYKEFNSYNNLLAKIQYSLSQVRENPI